MQATLKTNEEIVVELKLTRKQLDALIEGIGKTSHASLERSGLSEGHIVALHDLWRAIKNL